MRTRTLLASLPPLVVIALVALAPPVHAQEEDSETELSPDTEECIHLAEEADDPDACQEAPNLILPQLDELIWGGISFLALLYLLHRFAYPHVKQGMEARTERIRADLQASETAKSEAETVLAEYRAQLNDARSEAGRIIEEARQAADQLKRDQEARLQAELAEMRQRAINDIEVAKTQAMADLRVEVAQLAIGAAESIVKRNLDADTQNQLVEDYIDRVAASRS